MLAVQQFVRDVFAIAGDRLRSQLRMKVWIAMEIVEPIMWLLLYSQLYTDDVTRSFLGRQTYLDFFVPGLIVMGCFFSSGWCGLALLDRLRSGFINRMLVTPVSRWAIILGYSTALIISLYWQVIIVISTAYIMGWRPEWTIGMIAAIFFVITFIGLAFSSLSFALTFVGQNEDAIIPVINFVQLPLMFVSGIFLPLSVAPQWVKIAARFNPLGWARQSLSGENLEGGSPLSWILLLMVFAIVSLFIARRSVRMAK